MEPIFSNNLCAAYLVELVHSFEQYFPNGFLGRTAIQKLTYFAQATGVPVPCSFEIYNYGPYSDQVKFNVDGLLADEILTDTSNNSCKYSNYRLMNINTFPQELGKRVAPHREQIERVVKNLGNFRPEQLELIATLHFVHHRLESTLGKKPSEPTVIGEFHKIKRDKFDKGEVTGWYCALRNAGLV